ncbi:MAG: hypothetical protein PHV97_07910, partial [Candidatus Omnitrophica bacterium]|nr:hypothetical protein [Candidatus Omnitrophota bacterium]
MNDPAERAELEERAAKENWTQDQTREEVKKHKAAKKGTGSPDEAGVLPLEAKPGKPGTYKIVKATVGPEAGKAVIDLGFSNYY